MKRWLKWLGFSVGFIGYHFASRMENRRQGLSILVSAVLLVFVNRAALDIFTYRKTKDRSRLIQPLITLIIIAFAL